MTNKIQNWEILQKKISEMGKDEFIRFLSNNLSMKTMRDVLDIEFWDCSRNDCKERSCENCIKEILNREYQETKQEKGKLNSNEWNTLYGMMKRRIEKEVKLENEPKQEHKESWKEIEQKKVAEELKRYEEKHKEDYEEYKKAGYRELFKEEISKKSCWSCSHFRGGWVGMGCWCSQEKCDYKENETHLTRLHGWLTSDCRYIPIGNSHVETIYDEELKQKEKDIKSLYRKKLSWEKIYDGLIFKKNWIKLNAECYGICYSENLITKEQIEWLCKHRNIMTRQQKECLKEINDLKGK